MKTKKIINFTILLLITVSLVNCNSVKPQPQQQYMISKEEPFYTQVGMWTERGYINATNYKKGSYIPVNSPVIITKINSALIEFEYVDTTFYLRNIEKYTKIKIEELLNRTFRTEKVDLSQYKQKDRNAISTGEVTIGMSKEAVLIGRGFPPAHHTISLKLNSWKYWDSKFNTTIYEFADGKVSKIIK